MESIHKLVMTIVIAVALTLSSLIWATAWHNVAVTREMMERGYSEQIVPNTPYILRVKP